MLKLPKGKLKKKKKIRKFSGTTQKLLKQNKIYITTKQKNIRKGRLLSKNLDGQTFKRQ